MPPAASLSRMRKPSISGNASDSSEGRQSSVIGGGSDFVERTLSSTVSWAPPKWPERGGAAEDRGGGGEGRRDGVGITPAPDCPRDAAARDCGGGEEAEEPPSFGVGAFAATFLAMVSARSIRRSAGL